MADQATKEWKKVMKHLDNTIKNLEETIAYLNKARRADLEEPVKHPNKEYPNSPKS